MDEQNSSRSSNCRSRLEILQQFENEINFTRRTAFENLIRKYESVQENSAVIDLKTMTVEKGTVKPKAFGKLTTYRGMSNKAKQLLKELQENLFDSSGNHDFLDKSQNFINKIADQSSNISVVRACININETLVVETSVHGCDLESSITEPIDSNETLKESYLKNDTAANFYETPKNSPCRAIGTASLAENYDQECHSICDLISITSMNRTTPIRVTNQREPSKTLDILKGKLVDSNNDDESLEPQKAAYQSENNLVSPNRISIEQDRQSKGVSPGICNRFSAISLGLELRNGKTITPVSKDRNVVMSKWKDRVDNDRALCISESNQANCENNMFAITQCSQGHIINENKKLEIKFPEILRNSYKLEDKLSFEFPAKGTVGRNKKPGSKCLSNNLPPRKSSISKPDQAGEDICMLSLPRRKKMSLNDINETICLTPQHRIINRKCNETELNKKGKYSAITSSNGSLIQSHSNQCSAVSVNDSNREISFLNPQCRTDKEKSNANKLNETAINNETFGAAMSNDCSTWNPSINRLKLKHNVSMELEIVCIPLSSEVIDRFKGSEVVANNTDNKAEESSSLTNSHFASSLDGHLDESICNEELELTSDVPGNTRHYLRTIRRNYECLLNKNVKENTSNEAMKYIATGNSAVSSPKDVGKSSTSKKRLEYSPIATASSADCSVEENNCTGSLVVSNFTSPNESDFKSSICHRFTKLSLMHKLGNSPKTISSKFPNQIDVEKIGMNDIFFLANPNPLKLKQLVKYPSKSGSFSNVTKPDNFPSENFSDNDSTKGFAKSPEILSGHSGFVSQPRNRNDQRKRKADFENFISNAHKYFIQGETYDEACFSSVSTNDPSPHLDVTPVRKILSSKSNHVRRRIAPITACSSEMSHNDDISNDIIKQNPVDILPNVSTHHLIESRVHKVSEEVKTNHARKTFELIQVSSTDTSDNDSFSNDSMGSCSTDDSTNIGNRHLIESPACIRYRPKSSHKRYSSQKSAYYKTSSSAYKKSHVVHCSGSDRTENTFISKRIKNCKAFNLQSPKAEYNNVMKTSISRKKLNFSPKIFEGSFKTLSPKVQLK